jgi:hypothetical protein
VSEESDRNLMALRRELISAAAFALVRRRYWRKVGSVCYKHLLNGYRSPFPVTPSKLQTRFAKHLMINSTIALLTLTFQL